MLLSKGTTSLTMELPVLSQTQITLQQYIVL